MRSQAMEGGVQGGGSGSRGGQEFRSRENEGRDQVAGVGRSPMTSAVHQAWLPEGCRLGCGSNQLESLSIDYPVSVLGEEIQGTAAGFAPKATKKKKASAKEKTSGKAKKVKLVELHDSPAMGTRSKKPAPTSPAMSTRSKRRLSI